MRHFIVYVAFFRYRKLSGGDKFICNNSFLGFSYLFKDTGLSRQRKKRSAV